MRISEHVYFFFMALLLGAWCTAMPTSNGMSSRDDYVRHVTGLLIMIDPRDGSTDADDLVRNSWSA